MDSLLLCRLGLHPAKGKSKPWLHFECVIDSLDPSKAHEPDEGEGIWESLPDVVGEVEVDVRGLWRIPAVAAEFAVGLPIPLGVSGLTAFPVIRGVRLAKPDPEDPDSDLYSVILNEYGSKATVQVAASIMTLLGDRTLSEGVARLEAIALQAATLRQPE